MDLIARGGHDGGNTISYPQREMETVLVDLAVDLNARHGQGCGQGETPTTLGTLRAMETKMIVSSEDFTAGSTTLSTPRAMETINVESSGGLNARHGQSCGQDETTTLGTPRAIETKMIVSSEDFTARNTKFSTSRAMEIVDVESSGSLHARHGQGCGQDEIATLGTTRAIETKMIVLSENLTVGNTSLSTPRAIDTINIESSGDLISGKTTLGTTRDIETKMIVSSEDLTIGKTSLSTPRTIETINVESSGDLIAGKTTSCITQRATEIELVDAGGDSIAEQKQDRGQGNKTKFSISRERETETVVCSVDLMGRREQISRTGGNVTSEAMKNKVAVTNEESVARYRRVYGRCVVETGPSSSEGKATDKKRDLSVPERVSSSKRGARRGIQGTWNQPTQKRARIGEQNRDICKPGPRSLMEEGPSSPERQTANKKRGSPLLERERSFKRGTKRDMQGTSSQPTKRVKIGEQNKEISNLGRSSIMENGLSSPERQTANRKRGSPSSERVRPCKKTTLSWLIDSKSINEDERVCYKSATMKKAIAGRINRGRILCSCCQEEISVWTFERHAGSDVGRPYEHIYLRRKRKSLQKCLIDVWQHARERKRRCMFLYVPKETDADQNDDVCSVCGDGGDLICCDKCPSTYHLSCINIELVSQNDWFCPYCVCKHCGLVVDLVVEKKKYYEKKEGFKCSQCDKKCHWECFEKFEKEFSKQTVDLKPSRSYCGPGCQEIYEKMRVSLGIRNDYSAKYSWRVIRLMETFKKDPAEMHLYVENNSKVAVTWMLMNEAFETIIDRKTGINVVQSVVYSCKSNLTRIDFSRFYMFVLEEDDEIIAAACIRFHGTRIAEMPFIATETSYRGQGVCRELMRVIESFLCNLKVQNLIIPSAVETSDMWKRKYNFTELSQELKKEISSYKILMFPCALRLYKDLSTSIADIKNDQVTSRLEHGPSSGILVEEKE
ncbi:unnamed protein product [Sphenostylis stenocarpa]|uniref:PHD-type domain-containing protein n=1 Tax=Sphenostylis stenocarpa TaxID=92480 RepID=A0AA86SGP4_9FABA|nr:unnamed protein product [Sphenostylis stenocarpa]